MLCALALVAAVHMCVGLALLVQDPVLVHTLTSLGVTRTRGFGADFFVAGVARLFAHAVVAVVGTDIGITKLVRPPSNVFTLVQHCK